MPEAIHLGRSLDPACVEAIAEFICGDNSERYPVRRSSMYLTRFFHRAGVNAAHDGTTRKWWTVGVLERLSPQDLEAVVLRLVDPREYGGNKDQLALAVQSMTSILAMDGFAIAFNGTSPILCRAKTADLDLDDLLEAPPARDEEEFLSQHFGEAIDLDALNLDAPVARVIQARIDEAEACPREVETLAPIFLLGSSIEGILLAIALRNPALFMSAASAPKDKAGKTTKPHHWTLSQLIDVAHEVGILGLDVKKFSYVLRDFRNYIHRYAQMSQGFEPDQHTVDICWQVFRAGLAQMKAAAL